MTHALAGKGSDDCDRLFRTVQASSVNALGCGFDSPVVNCPTFPEENVMFCEQCITDTCDLIPLEQAHGSASRTLARCCVVRSALWCQARASPHQRAPAGDACVTPW